jgi:ribosomal protein S20
MHTRQSGAAHVNVFFFLVMLVLFLAALGTAYVTMDKNNQLEELARAAEAKVKDRDAQLFLYKHYVEDVAKEVGEAGEYAGREGFNYEQYGSPAPLQNVAVPSRVRTVMSDFAKAVKVPESRELSALFGLTKGAFDKFEERIANMASQKTVVDNETAELKSQIAKLTTDQRRAVDGLNSTLRQQNDDFTASINEKTSLLTAANTQFNQVREEKSDMAADHARVVADFRRQIENLNARIDAASDKVKLINPGQSPDGMVLDASQATGLAWINLGRLDMLPVGTTFEVVKPGSGEIKAYATVRRLEPTRAEVRITGLRDRYDPVMPGDMVRNDLYSPDMRHNIYLMGRFGLPYSKPLVTTLLENLGNKVVDTLGPGVDLIILGADSISEDGSGFVPITEDPDYELAKFLRIEMAPLSKVRQYLKLTDDDATAR